MIRNSRRGFKFSRLNSLLSWAFSRQYKKLKIIGIIIGSVTFKYERYHNFLNTELLIVFLNCWLCFFYLCWLFPYCSQLIQLVFKILFSNFRKNMFKPLLIWLVYLTLWANFRIRLGLMKSNGCVTLLNILPANLQQCYNPGQWFDINSI